MVHDYRTPFLSLHRQKNTILIKPFWGLIWIVNCYLNPEDLDPHTPQKQPPSLLPWCHNTEQMTVFLDGCLRVGVSKCVCFRVWQYWRDRNQENCAIRQVTRSGILDLHTHWKQEVCGWCVVSEFTHDLYWLTTSKKIIITSKWLKNRDKFDMFLFACFWWQLAALKQIIRSLVVCGLFTFSWGKTGRGKED